jgi:hypothetical protein
LRYERAPRRIGERRENVIQTGVLIVNHIVNYKTRTKRCQASRRRTPLPASGVGQSGIGTFAGLP